MTLHCGRTACRCTHTEGCEKGFIHVRYVSRKWIKTKTGNKEIEKWYDGVVFCKVCDPERAHIQETSRSTEELTERLRARSNNKSNTYEESKTRTL